MDAWSPHRRTAGISARIPSPIEMVVRHFLRMSVPEGSLNRWRITASMAGQASAFIAPIRFSAKIQSSLVTFCMVLFLRPEESACRLRLIIFSDHLAGDFLTSASEAPPPLPHFLREGPCVPAEFRRWTGPK